MPSDSASRKMDRSICGGDGRPLRSFPRALAKCRFWRTERLAFCLRDRDNEPPVQFMTALTTERHMDIPVGVCGD